MLFLNAIFWSRIGYTINFPKQFSRTSCSNKHNVFRFIILWRPPNRSDSTSIIFKIEITHLGTEASLSYTLIFLVLSYFYSKYLNIILPDCNRLCYFQKNKLFKWNNISISLVSKKIITYVLRWKFKTLWKSWIFIIFTDKNI